jgi:Asp-tRNAAsn/Glu-tRNAGln amidotransferase A subunit and related amidases
MKWGGWIGVVCGLVAAVAGRAAEDAFEWAEITIEDVQRRMEAGELTAERLTMAYLERIEAVDRGGPAMRAVIEVNPEALAIARERDRERRDGKVRGALHGVPVLIKDNIATADAMETTAGSLMLVGAKPREDAAVVERLREAGAVILGKTNLSEWANFRSMRPVSGWSSRGGQTRNPYALDRNPSGSSSGSAVAVTANLCVVAVGTETDGSIVSPASTNGIVGVKPTVGRVSRRGLVPIAASQDTAGPMARTVRDAALVLDVLTARDARDAATGEAPEEGGSFAAELEGEALRGARLGVLRGPFGLPPKTEQVLEAVLTELRAAGAEVVDLGEYAAIHQAWEAELEVLLYEFKAGLNAYLASLGEGATVRTLAEAIAFNAAHAEEMMPFFGQDIFELAEKKGPLTESAYRAARETCIRISRTEGIEAWMAEHRLDAIVTIAAGPAWMTDPVNGDAYTGSSSSLAAVAGYPSVSVPAGEVAGLPVGVLFTGRAWSERRLLALAADFERRTRARRPPEFWATVPLP